MKKRLTVFEILNVDRYRAWLLEVELNRKEEALETLSEEGILREEWFEPIKIKDKWYGFCSIDGDANSSNKDKRINQEHKQWLREITTEQTLFKHLGVILDLDSNN